MMRAQLAELLDPEAPGLDEETRQRRRVLAEMRKMSPDELRALAVQAGILTREGELTEPYKDDSPSPYREALMDSALDEPILDILRATEQHEPLRYDEVVARLRQRWAVSENDVLVRLRRMKNHGLVEEPETLCFSLTHEKE